MIGDSNGRMVRRSLEVASGKPVDFLGSSSGLHDLLFFSQLEAFLAPLQNKKESYDVCYFWMGYHSLINDEGEIYKESDYTRFEQDVENIIDFLQKYCKRMVICSALFPYIKKHKGALWYRLWFYLKPLSRIGRETVNEKDASIIARKNEILKKISNEKGLPFCDINGYMEGLKKHYRTRCIHFDTIHYEKKAYPIIAKLLVESKKREQ